jgi:molybdopterin synthase sulfur carrier subunit
MVEVRIKFFGPLRDLVQTEEATWSVPEPHTGERAFESLAEVYPKLVPWRGSVRLAVNLEYVPMSHALRAGDEVSFIPPVSGG